MFDKNVIDLGFIEQGMIKKSVFLHAPVQAMYG